MNELAAQQLAADWIEAWNRHDLDAIMAHYADAVEFTSPFVSRLLAQPDGTVRGRPALRAYFDRALAAYPDLRFTLQQVFAGVNSLTVCYDSVSQLSAAEIMQCDGQNRIVRVLAYYTAASSARKTNEWTQGDYVLTDDPARQDFERIHELMRLSYWANDRPREVMARGMRHSVCLGLLHRGALVGFARGVTDHATFTWVCDVMIHPDHRGRGLGKWMMKCCLEHPELQTTSQHLCTRDAHGLYEPFGFKRIEAMRRSSKPL